MIYRYLKLNLNLPWANELNSGNAWCGGEPPKHWIPISIACVERCWLVRPQWVNSHICNGKLTITGSVDGLSPERLQAIIWTNAGILLTEPLRTNFSDILIGIQTFSFKKMHLKKLPAKWRPFCQGLNVLIHYSPDKMADTWHTSLSNAFSWMMISNIWLTHWGLVTPYGGTCSKMQLHSSDDNFTRDIRVHQSSMTKINMKITHLKCHPRGQWVNHWSIPGGLVNDKSKLVDAMVPWKQQAITSTNIDQNLWSHIL